MKNLITLQKFGNTQKENFDLLVYIPHASIRDDILPKIRETSHISLDHISDEMLYKYLFHEADIGMHEVITEAMKHFKNSDFSIGVLSVEIPRGFCDFNRPIELATPKILENDFWKNIYKEAETEVEKVIEKASFVFQLHSMNSFNPIEKSVFSENVDEDFIRNHCEKVYSGTKRECTILTENEHSEYITHREFDEIFKQKFRENNIILEENTAYRLLENFPCTKIIHQKKSSFFELTKGSIATDETQNEFDSNKIVFDNEKIAFFGKILAEIFEEYLEKNHG